VSTRNRAPRRQLLDVIKTTGYGTTRYHHLLDCGHTEIRRRHAPAPTVACMTCAQNQAAQHATAVAVAALPDHTSTELVSDEASTHVDAARLRAGLAALLRIDLDDVIMHTNPTSIVGASVWITANALDNLRDVLLTP
jgi:hypothetical protein